MTKKRIYYRENDENLLTNQIQKKKIILNIKSKVNDITIFY